MKARGFAGGSDPIVPATYRPYFREAPGLYIVFILMAGGIGLDMQGAHTWYDFVGGLFIVIVIVTWALVIRFRFFVKVDDERLTARGHFRTHSVRWSEIEEVVDIGARGFWGSHRFPPPRFSFRSAQDTVEINFKLFSSECGRVIFGRIAPLRAKVEP